MTTKSAHGTHLGDFQPEELLGQLKAEQQSRNYDTAIKFIDAVLGLQLDASTLRDSLRDGVVLCHLINKLRPGAIKSINTRRLPFTQMENISNFLAAARKLGLESTDLFQTVDLYEGKNMPRVIMTLLTIARVVAGIPLNSHRKLADAQRTRGDGWNSSTLTSSGATVSPKLVQAEYTTMHNQPTLVSMASPAVSAVVSAKNEVAGSRLVSPAPHTPYKGKVVPSLRQERRRSKRRSATTLFLASNVRGRTAVASKKPAEEAAIEALSLAFQARCGAAAVVPHAYPNRVPPSLAVGNQQPSSPSDSADDDRSHCLRSSATEATLTNNCARPADGSESSCNIELRSSAGSPEHHLGRNSEASSGASLAQSTAEIVAARPRKRAGTKSRPNERLTVYSESTQRLANYQLGNCIGRGQFGSVYRALDLETGQMLAVKQILLEGQDVDNMEDIMQEVELLKSLSSPRIVRYHGFVKTDTHLNLVMEYVENGSLSATLKSFGSFPEKLVLAYAVKIIEGLIYLHGRDVVHCDLKACNILTTKQGNTKLTDFGVSLNLKLRKPGDESVVAGTPYWMAPEIIQLDGACMASDIWSLGCTVIELLTGKPPYSGLLQMAALYRIVEDDHPPIPEGISEELKDFLLLCFQKDPGSRPTAAELMSHSWTMQYRRNRKEMKMLRRTCSRKMSSYMARNKAPAAYPAFNPVTIKPLTGIPEAAGSASATESGGHSAPASPLAASHFSDAESMRGRRALGPQEAAGDDDDAAGSVGSGDDTDASLSTFEGPRMKRHCLRTILCDSASICALCAKSLSGAFIQCSSCKIRCHDACTRLLLPCTAMRMSRFLYPASRKSSKRYESKTPNIRLRAPRKSVGHMLPPGHALAASAPPAHAQVAASGTRNASVLASSDGSLRISSLRDTLSGGRPSVLHDGFDGVMPARPASIAVTAGVAAAYASSGAGAFSRSVALALRGGAGQDVADSGWETDDATDAGTISGPSPVDPRAHMLPAVHAPSCSQVRQADHSRARYTVPPSPQQGAGVASLSIPPPRQRTGPFSAPLATTGLLTDERRASSQQPMYYKQLALDTGANSPQASRAPFAPLPERVRVKSIRRARANTASLECLAGSAPASSSSSNGIATLLRRRQHPMRGATSSDFKAVAGFSPAAAQRAKLVLHGANASLADLQSCTPSELAYSKSDIGLAGGGEGSQCFAIPGKSLGKRSQLKRSTKDCTIM
ncbi:Protein kinase of the Mitotic Exit Network [Coemansia linderi]|uniref:Protein kinase of the Mitotic Exit Network n=1 Tax=Coemansia linderi TaxID=2663919 RepID=A0ACC1KJY6_9FUNG|nr:Protein kinase of the Mitotic Exit Network [Coemansia linderi]